MSYGIYEFRRLMDDVKKVYNVPQGKKLNIEYYNFAYNKGRWHIQIEKGGSEGLGNMYDPGNGEWWPIEMWLENPVEPVLINN